MLTIPNREFELIKFPAVNPNIVFSKEQNFGNCVGSGVSAVKFRICLKNIPLFV